MSHEYTKTCPDCGTTFKSVARTPSLGTHQGSQECRATAKSRRLNAEGKCEMPRVWRWILAGVVEVDVYDDVVTAPEWVSIVVRAARIATKRGRDDPFVALDACADASVPFIKACKKDPQLIEAVRAVDKLGGTGAVFAFMQDHQGFIDSICGCRK